MGWSHPELTLRMLHFKTMPELNTVVWIDVQALILIQEYILISGKACTKRPVIVWGEQQEGSGGPPPRKWCT